MSHVKRRFLFTSESVNEGHPDKICDQISDAVLDACLKQDPNSKVAVETACKENWIACFGELTTQAKVDFEAVAREAVKHIGFDAVEKGLDYKTFIFENKIAHQSPDIAQGVHQNRQHDDVGAGDQGLMFGYATDETEELMPMSHKLASELGMKLTEVRKDDTLPWLRPDGKTQVTMEYEEKDGRLEPLRVHTIVISTQHDEGVDNETIRAELKAKVVEPVIPKKLLDDETIYFLNPSGRFVIGGPTGDAGITGRKIIVDTYGGWGGHGGGAFSGKDCTKVDRSGCYAARWVAKSIVAAGLCHRVVVQVSYAIGIAKPLSVFVDSFGTAKKCGYSDPIILGIIQKNFDLRPGVLMRELDLQSPIFHRTSCYGHFGRNHFKWESVKPLEGLPEPLSIGSPVHA